MILNNLIYLAALIMMISGLYIIIANQNYFGKILGLGLFQNSILVFFIALAKLKNAYPPLIDLTTDIAYSAPLPHVLMLTAIVVGFATLSLALSFISKIKHYYGTIDETELKNIE